MKAPVSLVVLLAMVLGCGGGGSGGSGSGFTAKINGTPWAAEPIGVSARPNLGVPGGFIIVGSQEVNGLSHGITIDLNSISGPGTYPLGVGLGIFGGGASVGEGKGGGDANLWPTALDGLGGTINITTLSGGRIVATFEFVGVPDKKNTAGGTRMVTEGKIDLAYMEPLSKVPDDVGSMVGATLNGKRYNAWAASGRLQDYTGGAGVTFDSHSSLNRLSLMMVGVTAPGSYPISNGMPQRSLTVGLNGGDAGSCCWGQNAGGDTGTIVVTSLSPARVKGTFSGTLQPQPGKPATTPLVITDGVFDIGTR
jgi:hypothetical protein